MRLIAPEVHSVPPPVNKATCALHRSALLILAVALLLAVCVASTFHQTVKAQEQSESPLDSVTLSLPAGPTTLFLPLVTFETSIVASSCNLNEFEGEILGLMRDSSQQKRKKLVCNPILSQVARARAEDMATRNYFNHVNLNGEGPNYLVTRAGFQLPSWYNQAKNANNLESIAGGYSTPTDAWQGWMKSSSHATHLLGLDQFYADQTEIGVGYFSKPGSTYTHYWVVLSAPQE